MRFEPYVGPTELFVSRSDMDLLVAEGRAQRFLKETEDGLTQGWLMNGIFYAAALVEPSQRFFEKQNISAPGIQEKTFAEKLEQTLVANVPEDAPNEVKSNFTRNIVTKVLAAAIATGGGGYAAYDKVSNLTTRIEALEAKTAVAAPVAK